MLKRRLLTTLITAAVGLGGYAMNAGAANIDGNASATIVAPLKIVETTPMNFGSISPDFNVDTTVVLGTGGGLTAPPAAGGETAGLLSAGVAGLFTVTGAALAYTITLPADNTVTLASGANSMAIDSFISNPPGGSSLVGGPDTFNVGATLTVGADQPIGTYTGIYPVTVNYN